MSFDLLRPFRSCFLCKGRKKLKRTVNPGYDETFDYYHQECLDEVVSKPEAYVTKIDTAIQITDAINKENQNALHNYRVQQEKINNLKNLGNATLTSARSSADFFELSHVVSRHDPVDPDIVQIDYRPCVVELGTFRKNQNEQNKHVVDLKDINKSNKFKKIFKKE